MVKQESESQGDRRRSKRGAGVEEEEEEREEVRPPQRKRRTIRQEGREEEEKEERVEEGGTKLQGMLGNVVEQQSVGETRGTLLDSTLHRIHGDLRIALKSDSPVSLSVRLSLCPSASSSLSIRPFVSVCSSCRLSPGVCLVCVHSWYLFYNGCVCRTWPGVCLRWTSSACST